MKKYLLFLLISVVGLLGIFGYQYFSLNDGFVDVIFCNVGQGDGILIREPVGKYFMIDSGPDEKIIDCMERHMPFWERKISIAFLTHPHNDHFAGYMYVLKRYVIGRFVHEDLENNTGAYKALSELIKKKSIQDQSSLVGDVYKSKDITFKVIGPSREYIDQTSPGGRIGESSEFANLVMVMTYKNFDVLFCGDSQILGLSEALGYVQKSSIDVMHIPHHGSRFGLSESLLRAISPKLAVISVGKNKYGHPSREVIDLLKNQGIKYFRTDQYGDIDVVSDGEKFWARTE